jgi:hypothetical protein
LIKFTDDEMRRVFELALNSCPDNPEEMQKYLDFHQQLNESQVTELRRKITDYLLYA